MISVDPDGTLLLLDNTWDAIHEFVPTPLIDTLVADVKALGLDKGQENSLLAKLDAAQKSLDKGNGSAAKNQLNAFINEVLALFKSGRITEAVATKLIATAQGIINSISG